MPRLPLQSRLWAASRQLRFLAYEASLIVNRRPYRLISLPFSPAFHAVAHYRVNRCLFLLLGRGWKAARVVLSPLGWLLRPWFPHCEIHYEADIGRGLHILHPSLGVVIAGAARIGARCTLTGGNCVGTKGSALKEGDLILGDHVLLGANAVVPGPVRIGDRAVISAGSVVTADVAPDTVAGGVPARTLLRRDTPQG